MTRSPKANTAIPSRVRSPVSPRTLPKPNQTASQFNKAANKISYLSKVQARTPLKKDKPDLVLPELTNIKIKTGEHPSLSSLPMANIPNLDN
jgi:hypothetical protein